MSLHVLAYNLKRLMTSIGVAAVIEEVREYVLVLALQSVIGAIAVPVQSGAHKIRHSFLNGLKRRTTEIGMYASVAYA